MGTLLDLASLVVVPSGYKEDVVYSVKPTDGSGDLDFTRSNDTATRVNSAGLIEKVRTNLILQSQDFSTTWSANSCSVSTNTTANPLDGAVNADTITFTGGTTQKYVIQAFAFNGLYTVSAFLKAGTNQFVQFLLGSDASAYVNFDLVNGIRSGAFGSSADIISVGNGWYRCSMSFTSTIGTHVFISAVDSLAANRFDATTSTGTLIAFGYQLETGDIATDYIPTTTAAVSVGMTANVPRLDYSGGKCPKLLLEPQRTNLALYSEQFDNSAWTKTNLSVTANQTTSPAGYDDADLIDALTGTGQHFISAASLVFTNAVPYTFSVFAKKGNTSLIQLFGASGVFGSNVWATYNFDTLEVTVGSAATASMVDYGSGWYRLILTGTVTFAATVASFYVGFTNDKSVRLPSFTAANQTFYLWGAQTEQASYATSYIPTLGAAVTRGADACSKTGISSLIGQTEGTIFVEADIQKRNAGEVYIAISAGNVLADSVFLQQTSSDNLSLDIRRTGNPSVVLTILGANYNAGINRVAIAYTSTTAEVFINGVSKGTASFNLIPACSKLSVGSRPDSVGLIGSGGYSQTLLFPTRLTNTQLAELTTI